MNIRTTSLLSTALALLVASARADGTSVVVTPSVVSSVYVPRRPPWGPSFEPSVEVDSGNLAIGVWANTPISDKCPDIRSRNRSLCLYTMTVSDAISVAPGLTWYNYPHANTDNGFFKSSFEPNIAVNVTVAGVKFTPKYYYDMVLKGPTYELTATYAIPLRTLAPNSTGPRRWHVYHQGLPPRARIPR